MISLDARSLMINAHSTETVNFIREIVLTGEEKIKYPKRQFEITCSTAFICDTEMKLPRVFTKDLFLLLFL